MNVVQANVWNMRRLRTRAPLTALVAATALFAVTACADTSRVDPQAALVVSDTSRKVVHLAQADAVPDVVMATDRMGIALLTSAPAELNTVVSPASAVIALSMLAEGANGPTADQLDAALGASGSARTDAINALLAELDDYAGDPAIVQDEELPEIPLFHVANQVVLDDDFAVRSEYLDALSSGYGAGVLKTDLESDAGKELLDAWVNENTGGLIEESAIAPDPDLRLVLQNAVVLAARWAAPFEAEATRPRPFTLASGEQVETVMMAQERDFAYIEAEGWQAVRLPYTAGFHADVLLPPPGTDPASITPEISATVRTALDGTDVRTVNLSLPTLDIEAESLDLFPAFEASGLGDLFHGPDLSGINDEVDLVLSQAVQQATLTVDEAGTIAAAVTELGVGVTSAPIPVDSVEMKVDRPFLISIAHTDTSWSVFAAAIRDPRH